jgi:hypothetical protein
MALFTTFDTILLEMFILKSTRKTIRYKHGKIQRDKPKDKLRITTCLHDARNIPMMINLIEALGGILKISIHLYIMHLVALLESCPTIMMVHKGREMASPSKTTIIHNKTK